MGLRCLIGHDYGEPQTSRDVAERGNEVVVTVREFRECTRCGHTRLLSENKEVKAGGAPAEPDEPAEGGAEASWQPEEADDGQSTVEAFARPEPEREISAEEDDGIILEDEPEAPPGRAHGQWPEADLGDEEAEGETEHEPWPDAEEPPAEAEEDESETDPLEAGPEPTAEGGQEQTEILTDDDGGEGPAEAEPSPAPDDPPRPDNRDREFVCPDCGESWPTRNASLRPGDICPACKRGYIQEQVVQ